MDATRRVITAFSDWNEYQSALLINAIYTVHCESTKDKNYRRDNYENFLDVTSRNALMMMMKSINVQLMKLLKKRGQVSGHVKPNFKCSQKYT